MGIITKIEETLGDMIEKPLMKKGRVDSLQIEIAIKKALESGKKDILGKTIIPNYISILFDEQVYEEYEPFLADFESTIAKSLDEWMSQNRYEIVNERSILFGKSAGISDAIAVTVSHRKDDAVAELVNTKTGERYRIHLQGEVVGRGKDCTILINDPAVSRKHLKLSSQQGKIVLEDLDSKHGTRVKHLKVKKTVLNEGDVIIIGDVQLTFNSLKQ
jgi:hypothetical protein